MTYPTILVFEFVQAWMLTVIIALALRYNSIGKVDTPYRSLLFLFMMSYYAVVVQYLVLVPLYFTERQILIRERLSGVCRWESYILSNYLNEMPKSLFYACSLVPIGYYMMTLNGDGYYPYMLAVCLTVGVGAWQSNVTLCCCLTDEEMQVTTMTKGQPVPFCSFTAFARFFSFAAFALARPSLKAPCDGRSTRWCSSCSEPACSSAAWPSGIRTSLRSSRGRITSRSRPCSTDRFWSTTSSGTSCTPIVRRSSAT